MSILPTTTPSLASSRPRASWSPAARSAVSCASFGSGHVGRIGYMTTNHDATTGSKRLSPGHLDEVST